MSKTHSINKSIIRTRVASLIGNGRKQITTVKELREYSIGSLISYLNNNGELKNGGFLWKITDEYFIYLAPDFVTKKRVRFKNVAKMLVGNVHSVNNDIVSIVKTDKLKTNYPVEIDEVIVYYARSEYDVKRFKNTDRYINMMKWIEFFGDF